MSQTRLPMVAALVGLSLAASVGCTTKTYVRQQTAPMLDRVNTLDAETAKNTNAIKDVDARAQKGIAGVNQSTAQALQTAQKAQSDAQQVGGRLDQTSNQIQSLANTVANLDDYQVSYKTAVHFAFDRYNLSPEAKQTLDDMIARLQQSPHAILQVQGYTDATGPTDYNFQLSARRADSVVHYLESKNVAAHKLFLVGLGKNQFVAKNDTRAGRKENRRVELLLMNNSLGRSQSAQTSANSTPSSNQAQPQQ